MQADHTEIVALLAREYDLSVQSLEPIHEGFEGVKFAADAGPERYFIKICPGSYANALDFSGRVTNAASRRGYPWVLPPLAPRSGHFFAALGTMVVEVRRFMEARSMDPGALSRESLQRLGETLGQLHGAGAALASDQGPGDNDGPVKRRLEAVIDLAAQVGATDSRQAAAQVVLENRIALNNAAETVDMLRGRIDDSRRRWSVTHGDATASNFLVDAVGQDYLLDWTCACLAPPERDVVHYLTPRFSEFLAGYRQNGPVHGLDLDVFNYYLCRWQVDGVIDFGGRMFDDRRGDHDPRLESVIRLFAPDRSEAIGQSLAVAECALRA